MPVSINYGTYYATKTNPPVVLFYFQMTVTISFGVYPRNLTSAEKESCGRVMSTLLSSGGAQMNPIINIPRSDDANNCPSMSTGAGRALLKGNETSCPSGYKKTGINAAGTSDICCELVVLKFLLCINNHWHTSSY